MLMTGLRAIQPNLLFRKREKYIFSLEREDIVMFSVMMFVLGLQSSIDGDCRPNLVECEMVLVMQDHFDTTKHFG